MTDPAWRSAFRIEASHAALPGHFPGRPLVPGVVLLEQVAAALRAWRGQRPVRIAEAKFLAPLLPGEPAEIRLQALDEVRARFEIFRGDTLLARGALEGAAA